MGYRLLGDLKNLHSDLEIDAFFQRDIFLDCREPVYIEQNVCLGFGIAIITQSHDVNDWTHTTSRPVIIRKNCFIGSFCVLYNCEIGENCVVSCGTVIRSRIIPPNVMVEGNPVRIIKRKVNGVWEKCDLELAIKSGSPVGES